eukprot:4340179-Pyramimonas_sp.AAC.1
MPFSLQRAQKTSETVRVCAVCRGWTPHERTGRNPHALPTARAQLQHPREACLLYTSDAADDTP